MRGTTKLLALLLLCLPALAAAQEGRTPAYQRGYLQPQFVRGEAGGIAMLWVKPVGEGHDLFLARREANGALLDPVRVNSEPGSVAYLAHPEGRPGVAAGLDGRVAVSWFDAAGELRVAVSRDKGRSFEPAIAVDPGHGRAEHAFSDVAFDANGSLFVTWIDVRGAPADHEEPAQLYVARLDEGKPPVVVDLTSDHTESICGCCRPDLSIRGRDLTLGYRMIDPEGYRDIHRIRVGADLEDAKIERMGPPLWKVDGCPMAGPAIGGPYTWFLDGSTGQRRLMEASSPTARAVPITVAAVEHPEAPRLIEGSEGPGWMLYLPGAGGGQVLVRESGGWAVRVDDVPPFCTDIVLVEGQLLMVGERGGTLWMQAEVVD